MSIELLQRAYPEYGAGEHCPIRAIQDQQASCIAGALGAKELYPDSLLFVSSRTVETTGVLAGHHFDISLPSGPIIHMVDKIRYEDPDAYEEAQGWEEGSFAEALQRLRTDSQLGSVDRRLYEGPSKNGILRIERCNPVVLFKRYSRNTGSSFSDIAKRLSGIS